MAIAQNIGGNGDQAVVEWQWRDTEDTTGVRHRADDAMVIDFKDGSIVRWREYIDTRVLKT
jgi:ketosteroid isomerase-like protein